MNKQRSMWVVCGALLMFSAAAAVAQPQDQDHRDQQHQDRGQDQGKHGHDRGNRGHDRNYSGMYDRGRHEGWYKRGGYVPSEYREGSYVVTDWHSQHLRQPPRGYRYVRSDNGDFLLVAITTGVIVSILANH
ncbi:RcnB family protein [Rhodanobacter terrae]|uniref:RcnB family protein n=1 Tax=Rhodanobacter terrae TaxID=418647 RepID=A0ABW0SVQ8_9GAMM